MNCNIQLALKIVVPGCMKLEIMIKSLKENILNLFDFNSALSWGQRVLFMHFL